MKWIKIVFLSSLVLYILLALIDVLITNRLMHTNLFDGEYEVWNAINKGEIGEDLYLYGSSRTYVQLNPTILDKELNLNSYNLGFNGQRMEFLKFRNDEILRQGYLPKNVVLNLDIVTLEDREIYYQEQYYPLLFFNYSLYKSLNDDISLDMFDVYIPLIRYLRYRKYSKLIYEDYIKYQSGQNKKKRTKGFASRNYKWKEQKLENKTINVNTDRLQDLIQMIKDLQKVNTNIILINSPEYISQIKSQKNRKEIIKLYDSVAHQFNIPFINYSSDSMNFQQQYFYDTNHLNSKGADIFTKKLAEDIKPYIKR